VHVAQQAHKPWVRGCLCCRLAYYYYFKLFPYSQVVMMDLMGMMVIEAKEVPRVEKEKQ
jgi:hypothetical protein